MKISALRRLWKIEILIGKKPKQVTYSKVKVYEKDILELFSAIENIKFDQVSKREVYSVLVMYPCFVDEIYEKILYIHKNRKTKVEVSFFKSQKFKYEMEDEFNKLSVRIPNIEY